jgi:F420-dependent oxidoreductase-like protein
MRIGIYLTDVVVAPTIDGVLADAQWAEEANLATVWVPHSPLGLDALTLVALAGGVTSRIELGTAVVPTYPRHPLALAQQALSTQAACGGRLTLGIGPSHPHIIETMYGLSYEQPAHHVREYVDVLDRAFAGTGEVHYEGNLYRVNSPLDVPGASSVPVLLAALGPHMLQIAGERTRGTITWLADERALREHVVPRITAAAGAGSGISPRVVVGLFVAVCDDPDEGRARMAQLLSTHPHENLRAYQRILSRGEQSGAAAVAVVGPERAVESRLRSYRDAGATDLMALVFDVGNNRAASMRRTQEFLASLTPEL